MSKLQTKFDQTVTVDCKPGCDKSVRRGLHKTLI